MAERDTSSLLPNPAPRHWGGWVVLGLLLLVTLGVALGRADRRLDASETAAVLAAASLIGDRDLIWSDGDRARLIALAEASRPALRERSATVSTFDTSVLAAAWMAPLATASPRLGSIVATWLALAIAACSLALGLRGTLGAAAPWWASAAVWGSGAFAGALRIGDDTLVLALLTTGLALVFGQGGTAASELGDLWHGEVSLSTPRALGAGLLLGLAAASRPWLVGVLLVLPALLTSRGVSRRLRLVAGGLGMSIAATGAFASGAIAKLAGLPGLEPALLGRNVLTLLVGPRFGLVLVALPTVALLLGLGSRGSGRLGLLLVPTVALTWLALAEPFGWSGAPATLLGPLALASAATWWLVSNAISTRATIAVLLAGQVLVAGAWSPAVAAQREGLVGRVLRFLPWETTQPVMPGESETIAGALLVRSLDAALEPTRGGAFAARGGHGRMLLASAAPIETLVLRLSAEAPSELPVRGATAVETMYRPDGGVSLLLEPQPPLACHPDRAGTTVCWSRLDLELGPGGFTVEVLVP